MSILGTILVGFIVGLLARALKPGNDKLGLIMTTLLGLPAPPWGCTSPTSRPAGSLR
jgi:hypothetical protein